MFYKLNNHIKEIMLSTITQLSTCSILCFLLWRNFLDASGANGRHSHRSDVSPPRVGFRRCLAQPTEHYQRSLMCLIETKLSIVGNSRIAGGFPMPSSKNRKRDLTVRRIYSIVRYSKVTINLHERRHF